nr:uncharacterized protein LOC111512610 [Leptinotarsa decemlineata]
MKPVYLYIVVVWSTTSVFGQTNISSTNVTSDYPELKEDWEYCLEFTWFGPDYDNITHRYNGTCDDYLEEKRAKDIPCTPPIVISYDGSKPNMDYLWENHKTSILCRRTTNQRCVKYTYYFNNRVNNITYMCAKVHYSSGSVATGDFCYEQELPEGYKTEICVCKSGKGTRYRPCNSASSTAISLFVVLPFVVYQIYALIKKFL